MYVASAILIVASAVGSTQDAEQAKKLYDAMIQKLSAAKTQKITFEAASTDGKGKLEMKGTLVIGTENCVRLVFDGKSNDKPSKVTIISNGKSLFLESDGAAKKSTSTKDAPGHYAESLTIFSRAYSLTQAINATITSSKLIDGSASKPFAFKSLGQEKIGNKNTNLIEYHILTPDSKNAVKCKVWLDVNSNLPVQRLVEVMGNAVTPLLTSSETYSEWELDPKLPEGTFAIPKKTE